MGDGRGGEVGLEFEDGVAVISLDAPHRYNALTPGMAHEFTEALAEVEKRRDVGCLIVRGEGKAFCSGGDVATLNAAALDPAAHAGYDGIGAIYEAFTQLGKVGLPSIVAAQGAVVGAGMNMLLAADLRIVAHDVRLISGFLRRGMHPGGGHYSLLSRLAGREAATAMAIFGEELDGHAAKRLGIAWDTVPAERIMERAMELARRMVRDAELAQTAITTLRRELGPPAIPWDVAVHVERPAQMWSMRRKALADVTAEA